MLELLFWVAVAGLGVGAYQWWRGDTPWFIIDSEEGKPIDTIERAGVSYDDLPGFADDDEEFEDEPPPGDPIDFSYISVNGKASHRTVIIEDVNVDRSDEIYIDAFDVDKKAARTFKVLGISDVCVNGKFLTTPQWKYLLRGYNDYIKNSPDFDLIDLDS